MKLNLKHRPNIRLVDHDGDLTKRWYVEFYPKEGLRKRLFEPLNRYKPRINTPSEVDKCIKLRRQVALNMMDAIEDLLAKGFDFTDLNTLPAEKPKSSRKFTMAQSLDKMIEFLAAEKRSERTIQSFSSCVTMLNHFLEYKKLSADISPDDISPDLARQFQDWLLITRKVSPITANSYVSYLKTLYNRMKKKQLCKTNPFIDVELLKEEDTEKVPFTLDELRIITEKLPEIDPMIWLFSLHIFYCYIRPNEIRQLKRSNYDFEAREIRIGGTVAKGNRTAIVKMPEDFHRYLMEQGIHKLPGHFYIFGSEKGASGTEPKRRQYYTDRWKAAVKKTIGIEKDMYSMKHTSARLYLLNGGKIEWLQHQMRHADIRETQGYVKSLRGGEGLERFIETFPNGILKI
jgi:integrase